MGNLHPVGTRRRFAWNLLRTEMGLETRLDVVQQPERLAYVGLDGVRGDGRLSTEQPIFRQRVLFQRSRSRRLDNIDANLPGLVGAEDSESGVYGYLLAWDETPDTVPGPSLDATDTVPGTSADTTESNATSGVLGDGNWYLHVRTQDYVGHLASGATHFGPYGIDTLAPSSVVTGSTLTDPSKSWFYVELSGSDAGSGVVSYTVQYNVDGGSWQDFVAVDGPGPATRLFWASRYHPGHTYYFRSQATDALGHTEAWGAAEWSVYVPAGADPGGLSDARCPIIWKDYTIP